MKVFNVHSNFHGYHRPRCYRHGRSGSKPVILSYRRLRSYEGYMTLVATIVARKAPRTRWTLSINGESLSFNTWEDVKAFLGTK